MVESTKKEVKVPGITKRSIVITAVIFLALLIFQSLLCSVNNWLNQAMLGDNGLSMMAIQGLAIMVLATLLLKVLGRKRALAPQEYVFTYAACAVGLLVNDGWSLEKYLIAPYIAGMGISPGKEIYGKFWKPWFGPGWDNFEPALYGGATVPWGPWLLPMLFWGAACSVAMLYVVSTSMIFRRRWIDEEKVAFPYARIPTNLVRMATMNKEDKRRPNVKLILLFALFAILWRVPDYVGSLAPALFPTPAPGWPRIPSIFTGYFTMDLRTNPPGPWNAFFQSIPNAHFNIMLHPTYWLLGLIMPTNALLTVFVTWVMAYGIIPIILTYAGLIPNYSAASQDSNWGIFAYLNGWLGGGNIYMPNVALQTYGAIALGVFYLWFSRDYIRDVIKKAMHPTGEELETEAMSYRNMFLLMAVSGICMFFVVVAGLGAPIQTGLITLVAIQLFALACSRIRGEIGWNGRWFTDPSIGVWYWWPGFGNPGYFQQGLNTSLTDMTPEFFGTASHAMLYYGWNNKETTFGPQSVTFESLKLASNMGVHPKNVMKFIIIGYLVASFIVLPIKVTYMYAWGATNLVGTRFNIYSESQWVGWWFDPSWQGRQPWPWWPQAIAGFVVIGVVMLMRMKFVWFPFSAAGVVLGGSEICNWSGFGWSAGGIWAIKILVFRFFGSETYEKYVVPIIIGWVTGWMLSQFIIAPIWMARNLGFWAV